MKKKIIVSRLSTAIKAMSCLGFIALYPVHASAIEADTELHNTQRNLTFTLLTGDKVIGRLNKDGTIGSVKLLDSEGSDAFTSIFKRGGSTYVIPMSAQDKVDAGDLDMELFNIDKLYQSGYDDASSNSMQIIVEHKKNQGDTPFSLAMPGAKVKTKFEIIDSVVMTIEKDQLSNTLDTLSSNASIEGIWLDGMVEAHKNANQDGKQKKWWQKYFDIDQTSPTVPLTGVYGSNANEFDGEGIKIAVLDTGYDTEHPDLIDNVILAADFNSSGSLSVDDLDGHGTHVASTVAGSGKESNGKYIGMAPGADLLIGKVLNDTGAGYTSNILAGMQWAVDNGADIVSMSLGSSQTYCGGPLVEMVEQLSNDALFVISAGNNFTRETIGSPGCAPSALTVGAIDRAGFTAEFSSRGPSPDGHSVKPDITSQGVNVIASASGGKGATAYRSLSGTSMSAPHVSGGAAVVLQARPNLTPQQLKQVLTSSVSGTFAPVLEQGAGPMDVNRAIVQSIIAPPSMELGFFDYQGDTGLTESNVTLTNLSNEDITLDLRLTFAGEDGRPILFKKLAGLKEKEVTISANSSKDVTLWIDPNVALHNAAYGTITGRLYGTEKRRWGRKSSEVEKLTVPLSFWIQPPTTNLTITAFDRFGSPAASPSKFYILSGEDEWTGYGYYSNGSKTIELPKGKYSIVSHIMTYDNDTGYGGLVESAAMMAELNVNLDSDQEIVFDAAHAQKVEFKTDKPSQMQGFSFGWSYALSDQGLVKSAAIELAPDYVTDYYTSSKGLDARFRSFLTTRAFAPKAVLTTGSGTEIDYIIGSNTLSFNGQGQAEVVPVGDGGYSTDWSQFDVQGKIALVDANYYINATQISKAMENGAIAVIGSVKSSSGRYKANVSGVPKIPVVTISQAEMSKLYTELEEQGVLKIRWSGTAHERSEYAYSLADYSNGFIKSGTIRVKDKDLASSDSTYYAQGIERPKFTDVFAQFPGTGEFYSTGSPQMVMTPITRTEYFTPSDVDEVHDFKTKLGQKLEQLIEKPSIAWTNLVMPNARLASYGGLYDGPRQFNEAQNSVTSWDKAPFGNSSLTNGNSRAYRETNLLYISHSAYADAAGHDGGIGQTISSYAGILVNGEQATMTNGFVQLPDEPANITYVINTYKRAVGNADNAREILGAEHYTIHSFTTSAEDQKSQAVLYPVLDIPLDTTNSAKAGSTIAIKIGAKKETSETINLTKVKVNYRFGNECRMYRYTYCREDESVSYPYNLNRIYPEDISSEAEIKNIDGDWYAIIENDAQAGDFVHMRVIVSDGDSETDYSVLRAYQLN